MFRWVILFAAAAILVGCGNGETARLRFAVIAWESEGLPVDTLEIRIDDGSGARVVRGDAFEPASASSVRRTGWLDTRASGTLRLAFTLEGQAEGELTLDLRRDWAWEVQFHLADSDPAATCFGCEGSATYPLPGAHSLWVVWGGNAISDPVVH